MVSPISKSKKSWLVIALLGVNGLALLVLLFRMSLVTNPSSGLIVPLLLGAVALVASVFALLVLLLNPGGGKAARGASSETAQKLQELIPTVTALASHFNAAATQIRKMAEQQREGALRQSAAVAETRETLGQTVSSAQEIAVSSDTVHVTAKSTLEDNQKASLLVTDLGEHAQAIAQTVEQLKSIASKSEVLALNASLEGTKAGDAGKGFSLVAAQMRQLAEAIATSLKAIDALTEKIADSTKSASDTLQLTTQRADSTTEAGRSISRITHQQLAATKQVEAAMRDIFEITESVSTGCNQTVDSAVTLEDLSKQLSLIIRELDPS